MSVKIVGISRLPRVCHNFSLKVCVSSQPAICEGTLEITLKQLVFLSPSSLGSRDCQSFQCSSFVVALAGQLVSVC